MLSDFRVVATLPATDMGRAIDFYEGTLGLPLIMQMEGTAAMFQTGDAALFVYQRDEPTQARHTGATFFVDDVEAEVDGLIARGVSFEKYDLPGFVPDERGVHSSPEVDWLKSAWFLDPDGNILAISSTPPDM
jgi:catechol 2,3-dioxygenase-like lactoylglutathione lyase family enzyme